MASIVLKRDPFTIHYTPKRIISLVPSQTELLYDLGLENRIVGITKFCVHPKTARQNKKVVGGTKNIHIERIKALKPDIILCNKEENTKEIVQSCSEIAPVHVSDIYDLNDAISLISTYGRIFYCKEKARDLIQKITQEQARFEHSIRAKKSIKVAYFIWRKPWMVAADHTFINHLLSVNNFHNVFSDQKRYPEISLAELQQLKPEYVLLSSEPYPFKESHIAEMKHSLPEAKIILVDGEMFSWYGSRLKKAFVYFYQLRESLE